MGAIKSTRFDGWLRTISLSPEDGILRELVAPNRGFGNQVMFMMYLAVVGMRLPTDKYEDESEEDRLNRSMMQCEFMNLDKNQLGDAGVENFFGFLMRSVNVKCSAGTE